MYHALVWTFEQRWEAKFGSYVINLRQSLERLAGR
jgi:hypothetical protein